ncbi:MAG: hypothetical protein ACFFCI_03125 [Promethearchaeota archaeon]
MNIRHIVNRSRIRRLLQSRSKLAEVVNKIHWLEFENESILKFLAKYNILTEGRVNNPVTSISIRTREDTTINHQPKIDLTITEV